MYPIGCIVEATLPTWTRWTRWTHFMFAGCRRRRQVNYNWNTLHFLRQPIDLDSDSLGSLMVTTGFITVLVRIHYYLLRHFSTNMFIAQTRLFGYYVYYMVLAQTPKHRMPNQTPSWKSEHNKTVLDANSCAQGAQKREKSHNCFMATAYLTNLQATYVNRPNRQ